MSKQSKPATAYSTRLGVFYRGMAETVLSSPELSEAKGSTNLIFTSPPFPLNRKKQYGNLQGQEYVDWLASFAQLFRDYLASDGSIVIEVGNAWEPGSPTMSTLALRALLAFLDEGEFHLCQQFVWHNKAKLPSPAQWVNVERIRVKDAYTHLWWMAAVDRPKANNRNVLTEYSEAMKRLLRLKKYNPGRRPSEHRIGTASFLKNNKGAIPSNVLSFANTRSNTEYLRYCRDLDISPHPARMPREVAEFFIRFLTDEGDLVLDPFAGSNTTGAAAELLGRRWLSIEPDKSYIDGSKGRFQKLN